MSHYESTGCPRSLNGFCENQEQLGKYGKKVSKWGLAIIAFWYLTLSNLTHCNYQR